MGLDIYAGTMTRYYAKNWKTSVQQFCEEHGIKFNLITPTQNNECTVPPEEIQGDMQQWMSYLVKELTNSEIEGCEPWVENNIKDYYTDKPDWCAFGALLLYAACKIYNMPLSQTVAKDWNYSNDPIVSRAFGDDELCWSLFAGVEWWVPFDANIFFKFPAPNGHEIMVGTTKGLLVELEIINQMEWNADEDIILSWKNTEGYPDDGYVKDGKYIPGTIHTEYNTESLAKFAYSILYQSATFSQKNRVPVILDY